MEEKHPARRGTKERGVLGVGGWQYRWWLVLRCQV